MYSPILFIVFNRPNQTKETFRLLQSIKPKKLYIAADGPRVDRDGEKELCQQVREIVSNVDWDCEVNQMFLNDNLGCGEAVYGAITWFFKHEEEGIIIEDDCLIDRTFFPFCDELLEKYREDTRVMSIAAVNYAQAGVRHKGNECPTKFSYSFSRYSLMWGWATWRRAWEMHDRHMPLWADLKNTDWLLETYNRDLVSAKTWKKTLDLCYDKKIDTWDYHWFFTCWSQQGLTVVPEVNMVVNLGYASDAAHTTCVDDLRANLKADPIDFPLRHPSYINENYCLDRVINKEWFGITLKGFVYGYILKIPFMLIIADHTRSLRAKFVQFMLLLGRFLFSLLSRLRLLIIKSK